MPTTLPQPPNETQKLAKKPLERLATSKKFINFVIEWDQCYHACFHLDFCTTAAYCGAFLYSDANVCIIFYTGK